MNKGTFDFLLGAVFGLTVAYLIEDISRQSYIDGYTDASMKYIYKEDFNNGTNGDDVLHGGEEESS
mgnify:FL=1